MMTDSLSALGSGAGAVAEASWLQREAGGAEAEAECAARSAFGAAWLACRLSVEPASCCCCTFFAEASCCSAETRPESSETRSTSSNFSCCSPADEVTQ